MGRNNHARTKEKKKMLRLKAFRKRTHEKRQEKKLRALKPHGQTIYGTALKVAVLDRSNADNRYGRSGEQKRLASVAITEM